MDTMPYLGFPIYPVHQMIPITYMDITTQEQVDKCILTSSVGQVGKNRRQSDIPMIVDTCPFRPFDRNRESLFYLKKYLNVNFTIPYNAKYYYEIRSYQYDMSIGVSTFDNGSWVGWDDAIEYAYLVDDELPNDNPYLNLDTVAKQAIAFEAIGYENDLEVTVMLSTQVVIGFRNVLLRTQCLWFDINFSLQFADCDGSTTWNHVAYPIYTPPGLPLPEDQYHHPRLDFVNTKERPIPPFISWFPFREGINVFYYCYPGCLVVFNDTLQNTYDFDFANMIQ